MDTNTDNTSTELPAPPVLCINCAYIATNRDNNWEHYKCFAPQNFTGYNPVTGDKIYTHEFCVDARKFSADVKCCGSNGHWFLQAPPKPTLPTLYDTAESAATKLSTPSLRIKTKQAGDDLAAALGL
jgi:hypothetical protein